ncbi:MAG: hypothetical protein OXD36_16040 [Rhodobacter sp.]|nr:hypothetical protein [Rhodobacter sp.]
MKPQSIIAAALFAVLPALASGDERRPPDEVWRWESVALGWGATLASYIFTPKERESVVGAWGQRSADPYRIPPPGVPPPPPDGFDTFQVDTLPARRTWYRVDGVMRVWSWDRHRFSIDPVGEGRYAWKNEFTCERRS